MEIIQRWGNTVLLNKTRILGLGEHFALILLIPSQGEGTQWIFKRKIKAIVNVFENLSSYSIEYITVLCPTFHFIIIFLKFS